MWAIFIMRLQYYIVFDIYQSAKGYKNHSQRGWTLCSNKEDFYPICETWWHHDLDLLLLPFVITEAEQEVSNAAIQYNKTHIYQSTIFKENKYL